MSDERYNGWTNYATWNYDLWMGDDDEGIAEMVRQADDAYELSKLLEANFDNYIEEFYPQVTDAGIVADLFSWATGKIDWYSLAEHYWDEYREEEEGEEEEEEE